DVLAAALGVRAVELRQRLDDAVRAGVVRDAGDGQHLAFAHTVVRRALLMEADPERTRALHLAVADALSRDERSAPPLQVAHHYLAAADAGPGDGADAGLVDRAIRSRPAAADHARRVTARQYAAPSPPRCPAAGGRPRRSRSPTTPSPPPTPARATAPTPAWSTGPSAGGGRRPTRPGGRQPSRRPSPSCPGSSRCTTASPPA